MIRLRAWVRRWLRLDDTDRELARLEQRLACLQAEIDQVYAWLAPERTPEPLQRLRREMQIAQAMKARRA